MKETDLVKACLDLLGYTKGWYAWRNNTGALKTERGGFVRFGKVGSPDILAVFGGQSFGIECKVGLNKLSEAQKAFQSDYEEAGGIYWLIYDSETLQAKIKDYE